MIYFVRDEATLLIKIGFTDRELDDRLSEFQTGCPGLLTPLLTIGGTRRDETAWHNRFAATRERGEWFRPVPELLQAIDEAKAIQEEAQAKAMARALEWLKDIQQEASKSDVQPWTLEELTNIRMHQWEEERQKMTMKVAKLRELVESLGPSTKFSKLHGIINALDMQVEDGHWKRDAVVHLCKALLATTGHYHIPESVIKKLEEAIAFGKRGLTDH